MPADPAQVVALIVGPFGAVVLLAYIARLLWDAHRKEDDAKDARIATLEDTNDKLADALSKSTRLLDQQREERRRERAVSRAR